MADDSNSALLDLANNGAMLNQAVSELSVSVAQLANITLPVANGGTGKTSLTAYGVLCGGTTTTGAVQSVPAGTSGQVLSSAGAGAAPVFQTLTSSQIASALNATGSAPVYACRAWVNFDGTRDASGAVSTANTNRFIRASGNIQSVLRNAVGDYTIFFSTVMQDANYCATCEANALGVLNSSFQSILYCSVYAADSLRLQSQGDSPLGGTNDKNIVSVVIFR